MNIQNDFYEDDQEVVREKRFGDEWEKEPIQGIKKKKKELKRKTVQRELLEWCLYIVVVIVASYLFVTFIGQRTTVSGDSMYPALHDGDSLLVEKITYQFTSPERYDIIVFPYEYEENKFYIKRIIGLPGETVQIIDGAVYIDGELLESDIYGAEIMEYAGTAAEPITLGEGEYFVLGDNRNNSSDSRYPSVGVIQEEDIVGKAFFRIWPFSSFGVISHE